MNVLLILSLTLLASGLLQAGESPAEEAPDPLMARLQSVQQMRMRLEQDMSDYLAQARAKSVLQPQQPQAQPDLRTMRQDVQANLQRLEERFRCLDVDISGNNGNVVLVCGDNHGPVSTNNQQAFGADLNVINGGGL
ncbi:hypothetical protein [Marinobacterium jannaschii]|uniref:hypothetical protein n=1 Tax=Marinobacterium jannaschii TaxID=64970 RepID=UPI0004834429|nr:hypothetical protein [Marinobacterium jannaschii]